MPRLLPALLLGVTAFVAFVACGGDEEVDPGPPVGSITITSTGNNFDVEAFAVRAGEEVTVTYDNQDEGVAHNLRFDLPDEDPQTETATGPDTQTISFSVAEAGEYTYICDVHPAAMRGSLVAE